MSKRTNKIKILNKTEIIELHENVVDNEKIGALFGVTGVTIKNWLTEWGVYVSVNDRLKSEVINLFDDMTVSEICAETGLSNSGVRGILKKAGVYKQQKSVNHNSFDVLNEETLYWVGYIAGDGYISKTSTKSPVVGISSKDRQILEDFRGFVKSNHVITKHKSREYGTIYYTIKFSSTRICEKLEEIGITERKSLNLKVVPSVLCSFDFLRGVVDSDGHINKRTIEIYTSSEDFAYQISDGFDKLGFDMNVRKRMGKNRNPTFSVRLRGGREKVKELLFLMKYNNDVYSLKRKKEIAVNIINSND